MSANLSMEENDLVDRAVAWLNDILPDAWGAERSTLQVGGRNGRSTLVDPVINLNGPGANATFVVEARHSVIPRDVDQFMGGLSRTFRDFSNVSVLVVAPWMSTRTQNLLREEAINYIDLTGNAWIRSDFPAVLVSTTGASRNPEPDDRATARLRGAKAGRLVRTLVDVRPPYRGQDLAAFTGLNQGYISRLLDALDREALVERGPRREVVAVDYPALLHRWVQGYEVLKSNEAQRYVASQGVRGVLADLRATSTASRLGVTGSFAAARIAPVASPALLLAYADDVAAVAEALSLLPADEGANVVLLRPFDEVVWDGSVQDEGLVYVAPSQAVMDCLSGVGRMPAEGEALLDWMTANESAWRRESLRDFADSQRDP